MADLTITAANVGVADPHQAEIHDFLADNANVTVGKWVYLKSNKKVDLADANGGGTLFQCLGMVVSRRGSTVSVCKRGYVEGADTSGKTAGAPFWLSDTAGAAADAASVTKTVPLGRFLPVPDDPATLTLLLYIDIDWNALIP